MTHTDQIMTAVAQLVRSGARTFARKDVRDAIGVSHTDWMAGYTAIFQGMRDDQPGGAPSVGEKYKNVFHRVERGLYVLTVYGRELLQEYRQA